MTIQQLINELNKIEDKTRNVVMEQLGDNPGVDCDGIQLNEGLDFILLTTNQDEEDEDYED